MPKARIPDDNQPYGQPDSGQPANPNFQHGAPQLQQPQQTQQAHQQFPQPQHPQQGQMPQAQFAQQQGIQQQGNQQIHNPQQPANNGMVPVMMDPQLAEELRIYFHNKNRETYFGKYTAVFFVFFLWSLLLALLVTMFYYL